MYTGFAGQSTTMYESLTVNRTLLTSHATGVLSTIVTFKDKSCNGIVQPKKAIPQ